MNKLYFSMEKNITPLWYTTTSFDHLIKFKINVNYIIK